MWLELLVVTVCTAGKPGCSEATSAYYKQNTELQLIVNNAEKYGQKMIKGNEWIVYVATPAYTIATKQTINILLYRGLTFSYDIKNSVTFVQWNY